MNRRLPYRGALLALIMLPVLAGCSVTRELSTTPRTPLEQMLLAQSLERTLEDIQLPLLPGDTVMLEVSGTTDDRRFAWNVIMNWLRTQGYSIVIPFIPATQDVRDMALLGFLQREGVVPGGPPETPAYVLHATLHAFGTEQTETFVGVPPIQSALIPFSTPQLTLFGAMQQRGYTQLTMELYDQQTGEVLARPRQESVVTLSRYTALFVLTYQSTDLIPPPL